MKLVTNFHLNKRSVEEFVRVLLPEAMEKEIFGELEYVEENKISITVRIEEKKATIIEENLLDKIEDQTVIMLKTAILKSYKKNYPWGSLIGVRPTKMTRRILQMGYSKERVRELLSNIYLAEDDKIDLLFEVIETEERLLNKELKNIYIGIPFCPTKCRYCSFASYEIGSNLGRFYPDFVKTLLKEIELIGEFSKRNNMRYESIYIGGGTPSVLTERDIEQVLKMITSSYLKEFIFEAGREDSITREKLEILKRYGVNRISLNPQTFNEKTLKDLNRNFNKEHFDEVYRDIKELGFILNMDIILGLPNESVEDMLYTLKEIENYDMENLTVHSLAKKKGSKLYLENYEVRRFEREKIEKAIKRLIKKKKMHPYYLYRQKNSLDWGENVGYSIKGCEGRFNIEMIEENQETVGIGGGAISKIIKKESELIDQIERFINPKDPALYIAEMRERHDKKIKLFERKGD